MSKIELSEEFIKTVIEVDDNLWDLEYVDFGDEKIWYLESPQSKEYFKLKGIEKDANESFQIEFSEDDLMTITNKAISEKKIENYEKYLLDFLISHMTTKGLL
tara:strand:+ start:54 stop:362 length:309 start_codon:yes stop_codon:yes gene_type:complete